jgi:hypothetical protein
MEAPFFRRETTLQLPRPRFPREFVIPEEFVAEEDLHRDEKKSVDTVNEDDDTVRTLNLPPPRLRRIHLTGPSDEGPSPLIRIHQRPRRRTPPFPPLTIKPS